MLHWRRTPAGAANPQLTCGARGSRLRVHGDRRLRHEVRGRRRPRALEGRHALVVSRVACHSVHDGRRGGHHTRRPSRAAPRGSRTVARSAALIVRSSPRRTTSKTRRPRASFDARPAAGFLHGLHFLLGSERPRRSLVDVRKKSLLHPLHTRPANGCTRHCSISTSPGASWSSLEGVSATSATTARAEASCASPRS
jgi:hypothetical protein